LTLPCLFVIVLPEVGYQKHDSSYKQLFSHPQMVQELLQTFVRESWVAELDFFTLKNGLVPSVVGW